MKNVTLTLCLLPLVSWAQFSNPVPTPPLLNAQNCTLTCAPGTVQFYPSITTNTFGINGNFLGPTLYINKWDSAHIWVVNNLIEETTMHWHGMHVPSIYDGGPHMVIPPNGTFANHFRILQPASTNWYHPHMDMNTLPQVTKGLAGMFIVRDSAEGALNLPRTYGTDDFPIILMDRKYLPSGDFNLSALGDSMLVNGVPNPYLNVPAQVVRLRVLNGSNARTFNLGFSDNRNFQVIASDGGLIAAPYTTNRLLMTNGERYEILLNLTGQQGDSVYLVNYGAGFSNQTPGGGGMQNGSSPLNAADFSIMKFRVVAQTGSPVTNIPGTLLPVSPWLESNVNVTRNKNITGMGTIEMGNFPINGLQFDMNIINDTMYLDDIELWRVVNSSNFGHPMHIHDISFYMLRVNGSPPPPHMQGLKDVFLVMPGDTVEFITKFEHFVNDTIPYMFHCHNLAHEDMGMMTSFIVILPPVGEEDQESKDKEVKVFPNPSKGRVLLESDAEISAVEIYDHCGKMVYSQRTCGSRIEINLSDRPSGLYLIRLENEGVSTFRKLILVQE